MKTAFLCIFALCWPLTYSFAWQVPSEEVRLALTQEGYEYLLPSFKPEVKERVDFYIEAWDRSLFSLQGQGLKLRVKNKDKNDTSEVQLSRKLSSGSYECSDFYLGLSHRRAYNTIIDPDLHGSELMDNAVYFFHHLRLFDPRLEGNIEVIDGFFKGPNYNGREFLKRQVDFDDVVFVPSKINRKTRVKLKMKDEKNRKVTIVLGETVDADNKGVPIMHYELEAEGEGPLEDVANVVCDFLKAVGFQSRHIETEQRSNTTEFTQSLINSYFRDW